MSLATILRRGVGLQLEVMTEPSADALAETLVAFANGDGGTVLLGAHARWAGDRRPAGRGRREPPARRAGAVPAAGAHRLADSSRIAPGWAVAIHVPRSTELHSLADGRVLVRTHQGNEPLDGGKISHLAATKASGDYRDGDRGGRHPRRPGR